MTARMISNLIDATLWEGPLAQFAKASGLTLSLYGADQQKLLPHLTGQSFSSLLAESGFYDAGPSIEFERAIVKRAFEEAREAEGVFKGALPVFAFPLMAGEGVLGVVAVGWAFRTFPDPVTCARLANDLSIPENLLWLAARENAPVGGEKLAAFLAMLKTWNTAILSQLISLREANEASRLKDQFLAIASHELRTPLTSIILRTQALRKHDTSLTDKARNSIASIERSAVIQSRLVDDLLETSRLLTGKMQLEQDNFDPASLAQEAYETGLPAARAKKIDLTIRQSRPRDHYRGDSMRIQQVFWNLVNNAVKFTPEGGHVKIATFEEGGSFCFEVSDSGRGLAPEEIRQLFQPFYQAMTTKHGMNTGMGLGLSIAKAVVDMHSGSITALSDGHGRGATFRVEIPAKLPAAKLA